MTPDTIVIQFAIAVFDISSGTCLYEFPERFVRCTEEADGKTKPIYDHLYEVVETLIDTRRSKFVNVRTLEPLDTDDMIYYTHQVTFSGRSCWICAGPRSGSGIAKNGS